MQSATALLALIASVKGNVIRGRQLSGAAAIPPNPQPANLTSGGDSVSTDASPLESNTEQYYLGFREADFEKPYAKYYNPVVSPISDALVNGLAGSPWPSAFTDSSQDAAEYLEQPGYLNLENGCAIGNNGTLMIAVRSEIPQVTGEQYDWWFGWHSVETARYKLWNPIAHQYSYRTPDSVDWVNRTYAERYIGATSYIDEYVGNDAAKLSIQFIEPESMGFNTSAWPELGIETVVVGKLFIGGKCFVHSSVSWLYLTKLCVDYSLEEFDQTSYLMHMVRRMPNGYRELRSRFFVASDNHGNAQLGHDLAVHCNIEMTHLGSFLPALFQEFKGTK
ncbi:Phloretin hydrolase [Colletotrichum tropicale]|nr:Phloretin hydrolase [Colletotrichum tropicale]